MSDKTRTDSVRAPHDPRLTRRQLIGGAAAGVAGLLLPSAQNNVATPAGTPQQRNRAQTAVSRSQSLERSRAQTRRGRNVLLIVAGGERSWDRLPAHLDVPARERMQQRSVEFPHFYSASPTSAPAMAALLTGLHGPSNGVTDSPARRLIGTELSTTPHTLADLMRDGGWHTAYFGDWTLSSPNGPLRRTDLLDRYGFSWSSLGTVGRDPQLSDKIAAREVVTWLTTRATTLRQPWLATVYLNGPSSALRRPDELLSANDLLSGESQGGSTPMRAHAPIVAAHARARRIAQQLDGRSPLDEIARARLAAAYDRAVLTSDERLGEILDALQTGGAAPDTIIIYTTDCGALLGGHGQVGTGPFAYSEVVNVPLLIDHPDGPGAVQSAALTSSVDLLATVLALANVPHSSPTFMASRSFALSVFEPTSKSARDRSGKGALLCHSALSDINLATARAVDEYAGGDFASAAAFLAATRSNDRGFYRAIVEGRYTMARYFAPRRHHRPVDVDQLLDRNDVELYDRKRDSKEKRNLARAGGEMDLQRVARLNDELNALIARELGSDDGAYLPGPGFLWRG